MTKKKTKKNKTVLVLRIELKIHVSTLKDTVQCTDISRACQAHVLTTRRYEPGRTGDPFAPLRDDLDHDSLVGDPGS